MIAKTSLRLGTALAGAAAVETALADGAAVMHRGRHAPRPSCAAAVMRATIAALFATS